MAALAFFLVNGLGIAYDRVAIVVVVVVVVVVAAAIVVSLSTHLAHDCCDHKPTWSYEKQPKCPNQLGDR